MDAFHDAHGRLVAKMGNGWRMGYEFPYADFVRVLTLFRVLEGASEGDLLDAMHDFNHVATGAKAYLTHGETKGVTVELGHRFDGGLHVHNGLVMVREFECMVRSHHHVGAHLV